MSNILYVINVEAAIYEDDRWLIIKRSELEEHAPGELSLVGGKVENASCEDGILESTLKREIEEEVGITIFDNPIYIESKTFSIGPEMTVVDIVFLCRYKCGTAKALSDDEVSEVHWYTTKEILDNDKAPYYLKDSIRKADKIKLCMSVKKDCSY